jgi:agmatinase
VAIHGPVALIHFDAHTDTEVLDGVWNHGSMFRQALDEGLIDAAHSVQLGIRTEYEFNGHPFTVLDARWVNTHSPAQIGEAVQGIVGTAPAYLTFDIDCLDPAFAPGTGTPVPGGISTEVALEILRQFVEIQLVGMDVVEVAPVYDSAEITALAAAAIALEMLYVLAAKATDLDGLHDPGIDFAS